MAITLGANAAALHRIPTALPCLPASPSLIMDLASGIAAHRDANSMINGERGGGVGGDGTAEGPAHGAPGPRSRWGQPRPPLTAPISSPLAVSPDSSQKKAPPSPWFRAYAILPAIVAGVS